MIGKMPYKRVVQIRSQNAPGYKKKFLDHYRECGNMKLACELIGINRRMIFRWKEHDEAFLLAFNEANIEALESLEAEAWRRAVKGVEHETPLLHKGEVVTKIVETKYSDRLLELLLKARAPEKYRERLDVRTQTEVPFVIAMPKEDIEAV